MISLNLRNSCCLDALIHERPVSTLNCFWQTESFSSAIKFSRIHTAVYTHTYMYMNMVALCVSLVRDFHVLATIFMKYIYIYE